jgi:GH15 family glucan-1,4-alpha-glucosidase
MRRVLFFYECQDVDQTGLISMQEASDWQDLFCTRGKGLYLNALYVLALQCASTAFGKAGSIDNAQSCRLRAELVKERINEHFWYRGDGNLLPHVIHTFSTTANTEYDSLGRKRWLPQKRILADQQYYLPYLSFRTPGEWFDTFGHLLVILAGISDAGRSLYLLDWMERHGMTERPAAALYPPVAPGDADWRPYYGTLNAPHRYHNGGIWPFLGGFYVAALCATGQLKAARAALERLAYLNRAGLFNEWHLGSSGDPMGVEDQAWSAGMYLFAYQCVRAGRLLLFNAPQPPDRVRSPTLPLA